MDRPIRNLNMARKKKQEIQEELPQITIEELTRGIGDIAREAYSDYAKYVNTVRHIVNINDGCKVSYRRLIFTSYEFGKAKGDIPTSTLLAAVSKIHPHSVEGMHDLNAELVRSGIFSGEGNFGSLSVDNVKYDPSAARYTKNRLSDLYWKIIGPLMSEVSYSESPVSGMEPDYLPLPQPLALFLRGSVQGLGVGLRADYPSFDPWSMYQAMVNNNPLLLEPRIDLILDKKNSELNRLWSTGKGRVIYSYKISRAISDDGRSQGILFEGDTDLFAPPIMKNKTFKKWLEDGKVYYENMTDINGPKLFVGKVPNAKGITIEDIEDLCRKNCFSSTTYNLNVTDGHSAFRIPLKDWLEYTYKNYIDLVTRVNLKRIEKCLFDIAVNQALPQIASYILNVNPKADDKELVRALNLTLEVVEAVMGKPISWLRKNQDTTIRVKQLKDRLKELKSFDPVKFTEEIIKQL